MNAPASTPAPAASAFPASTAIPNPSTTGPHPDGAAPSAIDVDAGAARMLEAMDATRDAPAELAAVGADLATGLAIQQQINRRRLARGDRPVGFKIGFTNRTIWSIYGVHAPIWAPVWHGTAHDAPDARFDASAIVSRLNRPRLEPEIVLGLRAVPAGYDPAAGAPSARILAELEAAIDWVAHGFELVQSPWPDWKFGAGQAMASQSLHGALIVGPRRKVRRHEGLAAALSAMTITLYRDGAAEPVARGNGSDVLDGPIQALGHWLHASREPAVVAPAIRMMVTTGTLTDAQPVTAGQQWQTRLVDEGGGLAACLDGPPANLFIRF